MNQCNDCGNKYSRSDNLKRHQISCKVKNKPEIIIEAGVKRQYGANEDRSLFVGENTIPVDNDKKTKDVFWYWQSMNSATYQETLQSWYTSNYIS